MLSVSAQHSRKHRKQQKTAVAQSVEPQTTVKGKGKKAVNAINNNHAVAPATPVKGQKPILATPATTQGTATSSEGSASCPW